MISFSIKNDPKKLLNLFTTGSLVVVLVCACVLAVIFSASSIKKEREREVISTQQINSFFSLQYRTFAEEMWTQSYESIDMRAHEIANQFGNASYKLLLADTDGNFIYNHNFNTKNNDLDLINLKNELKKILINKSLTPVLKFDSSQGHYQYIAPLYVGTIIKGYMLVSLSDPYQYYRGSTLSLAAKIFLPSMLCLVLMWYVWVLISRRFILKPYLEYFIGMEKKASFRWVGYASGT